jgi:hypothetical protein
MLAVVSAWGLWVAALMLPVWLVQSQGRVEEVRGTLPAMIGFLGIARLCPAWYANLLLFPASCIPLFVDKQRWLRIGFWISTAAFFIALTAYIYPALDGDNASAPILAHRVGYYCWLGSFVAVGFAHALRAGWTRLPILFATGVVGAMAVVLLPLEAAFRAGFRFPPV